MNICKCPVCHSHIDLMSLVTDDGARELLSELINNTPEFNRAALTYLTLFQPAKSNLSFDRSLRLYRELQQLTPNKNQLQTALNITADSLLQQRQQSTTVKPLKNHNYLKRVLETTPEVLHASSKSNSPTNTEFNELTDDSWLPQNN